MNIVDIKNMLSGKNGHIDKKISQQIVSMKEKAIQASNEILANILWCYEMIYNVKQSYLSAYKHMKEAVYEDDIIIIDGQDTKKSSEEYTGDGSYVTVPGVTFG